MGWQSTRALRTSLAPSSRLWRHLLPNIARATAHGLWYRPAFRMRYAWRTGCGGSGWSPGIPLWKPRSTACRGRWPAGSTCEGKTSGMRHSNPSIPKTNRSGGWPSGWWEFLLRLPLVTPGGIAISDSEKAEALADNLKTQFQPVTDPSVPAGIEMVEVVLRSYFMTPASEPKLTNPEEGQEAIRCF